MTQRKYTNRSYLDALEKKVLVFDGAMGTSLQCAKPHCRTFRRRTIQRLQRLPRHLVSRSRGKIHCSFLEVGVDVLETDTFRSNRITMAEYKLGDRVIEINETAAKLACLNLSR